MLTQTSKQNSWNAPIDPAASAFAAVKSRQKQTWESGDYGRIARHVEAVAGEFMARLPLRPGLRVLDLACGTGNLAVLAATAGCAVTGVDIADNLLAQARSRAAAAKLSVEFQQADAEALPFADATFDWTVSMFGIMFTPRPELAAGELRRVTKPGGRIALANWTPEGFIGKMFRVIKTHRRLPLPPLPRSNGAASLSSANGSSRASPICV